MTDPHAPAGVSPSRSTDVRPEHGSVSPSRVPEGRFCAILTSPPLTSGTRTRRQVLAVAELLGYGTVDILNLCASSAQDLGDLAVVAQEEAPWVSARPMLEKALAGATHLLAAWGVAEPIGAARRHQRRQLDWLRETAEATGHSVAWCIGGEPRHPSRWHQYVSDRHGRTAGGSPRERLAAVLSLTPLDDLTRRPSLR